MQKTTNDEETAVLLQKPVSTISRPPLPKNFIKRNFCRKLSPGSLRGAIINFMRIALGIGMFTLPFYVKQLGLLNSLITIIFTGLGSYYSFLIIFEASEKSGKKNLHEIIRKVLGKGFYNMSLVTLFFDFMSSILIFSVTGWNLFQYLMYSEGFFKKEWIVDENTLAFDESNPVVREYRYIFFFFIFVISSFNLTNEKMDKMKYISLIYIIIVIISVFYILFQMPFFRQAYISKNEITLTYISTKPSYKWLQSFFSILSCFNAQIYVLDIKKDLFNPSLRRLKKMAKIGISIEILIFGSIGLISYFCLGDKFTPELILLTKPLESFWLIEIFMKILIFFFFIFTILGLPLYYVSFKNLIFDLFFLEKIKFRVSFGRNLWLLGHFWGYWLLELFRPILLSFIRFLDFRFGLLMRFFFL